MSWVKRETPQNASFLVVPQSAWETDRLLEWFPALTKRRSVLTVQGTEWTGRFFDQIGAHDAGFGCAHGDASCLDPWLASPKDTFTYVYLPDVGGEPCCSVLGTALSEDPDYVEIYSGPGAAIFRRTAQ
jgi:hypothetical protein